MSRSLVCDRCGAQTTADKGPRRIAKPVGWVYVHVGVKDQQIGAPSTERHDLCPDCGTGLFDWLNKKET